MLRHWLALALAFCPVAAAANATAAAQPNAAAPAGPERWQRGDERVIFTPANVAFPRRAGILESGGFQEFSNPGQGLDNGLQYRSRDGRTIGTVYVYYPGLPHSGFAAWATDNAIRANSASRVQARGTRVVAAGGVPGVAIRMDYSNYRNGNASSAAFVKAGRWIVKLRVTGPNPGQVDAAMDALIAGLRWGASNPPQPAMPVTVAAACTGDPGSRAARPLPDPNPNELAAYAMLGTFDGGGIEARDDSGARVRLPSRIPPELCLSSRLASGVPILRSAEGDQPSIDGRTRLLAVLSDAGAALEIVYPRNIGRYLLLYHQIGETSLLGTFDGVPSDRQIADIIAGRDRESARVRALVRLRPGEGDQIHLNAPDEPAEPARPVT
ncbi:MAG TPA: hypothetical protein VD887_08745 [Allosphingosinicella sp.]|nr:hypothetical protein [Allosphingosinicella sp.]